MHGPSPQVSSLRRWALPILGLSVLVLVVFVVTLLRGSVRGLPRVVWTAPPPAFSSWDEVFRGAPKISLHTLDTGVVHSPKTMLLPKSHPAAAAFVDEDGPLHVYAHLVRHPSRGDVLVDSGLDASFLTDRFGNIQRPARWVLALMQSPYSQKPGQDVAAQLRELGAHPSTVFFTHLHMDHTAGVPALGSDIRLVTGPGEADDPAQIPGYGHISAQQTLYELDFKRGREMPPLGRALDLFGDGSFWALETPGHSRGHTSFLVNTTRGPVLLTGDASHFHWAFDHGVGPAGPSADDEKRAQQSLERLKAMAQRYPALTVHLGHQSPR